MDEVIFEFSTTGTVMLEGSNSFVTKLGSFNACSERSLLLDESDFRDKMSKLNRIIQFDVRASSEFLQKSI